MRKIFLMISLNTMLVFAAVSTFAQGTPPPPPSGGPGAADNNSFVRGGNAPVGDGLLLMLLMGGTLALFSLRNLRQQEASDDAI